MNNKQFSQSYDYKNSLVAKDNIWKDYVKKANAQAKEWPNVWGEVFLDKVSVHNSNFCSFCDKL